MLPLDLLGPLGLGTPVKRKIAALRDADGLSKAERDVDAWMQRVGIVREPDYAAQLGRRPELDDAMDAARFLSGNQPDPVAARRAMWEHEQDHVAAALAAHGLDPSAQRQDLLGVLAVHERAAQPSLLPSTIASVKSVAPVFADGAGVAQAVERAYRAKDVEPAKLGGKHSEGAVLVDDREGGGAFLLKPGSGQDSPAEGLRGAPSTGSQSQREAAFYRLAQLWGLGSDLPRCDLLEVDGRQVACIAFLGGSYEQIEQLEERDHGGPARVLEPYRRLGRLHQWAVLDFVAGQTDRHAGNVLVDDRGDVKLIDEGSTFAGKDFDPARDRATFVPCYLRYTAPTGTAFNLLAPEEKLRCMVSAPTEQRRRLWMWLHGLREADLAVTLPQFGIDPSACVQRLRTLQASQQPVDVTVNRAWVST